MKSHLLARENVCMRTAAYEDMDCGRSYGTAEPGSAAASNEEEEEGSRRRSTSQVIHRLSRRWRPYSATCWVSVTVTKPI